MKEVVKRLFCGTMVASGLLLGGFASWGRGGCVKEFGPKKEKVQCGWLDMAGAPSSAGLSFRLFFSFVSFLFLCLSELLLFWSDLSRG